MTRYTTVFLVLGGLLAGSANADERGISMLQMGSRAARTANLAKMSEEVVAQVSRGKVTPEVQKNIDEMLKLIVNITGEINADYTAAQKHYNTLLGDLDQTTKAVVGKKTDADSYDEKRFQCYGAEKLLLVDWETKAQTELDERLEKERLCNIREDRKFTIELSHFGAKTCNVSDREGLTGATLDKCLPLKQLKQKRDLVRDDLVQQKVNHTQAHHACDVQTEIHRLALLAKNTAWTTYETKRELCTSEEYSAENVMCEFGVSLQEKCDALRAMLLFKGQVEEVKGTHHSEVDRKKEWDAMMQIKCLLKSYVDSPPAFDDAEKTKCLALDENQYKNNFNYAADSIDAWSKETSASVTGTWSCAETHVTFHGQAYKIVPSSVNEFDNSLDIHSSDYKVVDMNYEVNNDSNDAKFGGDPFSFCNAQTSDGSVDNRRDH